VDGMEEKVMEEEKVQTTTSTETTGTESLVSDTIATLKGIPTKADLKNQLEQNVVVVDFTKLNGDKRVMTCTLREDMKPAATKTDAMSTKKVREISDAVVSVWDVNAKGWRSFRYDRINAVNIVEEYETEWYNKG
jgi:dihydrodipicolinate reductase